MPRFKRLVKHIIAVLVYYSGMLALMSRVGLIGRDKSLPVILMYHRVTGIADGDQDEFMPGMVVTEDTFAKQMVYLLRKYNVISLIKAVDCLRSGQPLPERAMVITFDDGWRDNFTVAYPILNRYRLPATIFLPTDFIGSGQLFWFLKVLILFSKARFSPDLLKKILAEAIQPAGDRAGKLADMANIDIGDGSAHPFIESLKKYNRQTIDRCIAALSAEAGYDFGADDGRHWLLKWDEVRQMKSDRIDFGSHGCSHQIFTLLTDDELPEELRRSQVVMEKELAGEITLLSYPNGNYNNRVVEQAARAGYQAAVIVGRVRQTTAQPMLFTLPRVGIHERMTNGIDGKFSQAIFACYTECFF